MLASPDYASGMAGTILSGNILALRSHLDLTQAAFAERIGSQQSYISKWEKQDIEPEAKPLATMAKLAGVDVETFMTKPWERPPRRSAVSDHQPTRSADGGQAVEIMALDLSLSMGPGTIIEDFVESEPVMFDVAMLRRITSSPFERLRVVTGIGSSHEPKFQHADQFLIDINERQLSRLDGYYWITFEGAHALKRLRPLGKGRVQIISENPSFGPMDVDAEDVRIEGRAIWFARGL